MKVKAEAITTQIIRIDKETMKITVVLLSVALVVSLIGVAAVYSCTKPKSSGKNEACGCDGDTKSLTAAEIEIDD